MYRDPDPRFESLGGHPVALRPLRVGMIGIGTVGAGTFRVLARNQAEIAARAGRGTPRSSTRWFNGVTCARHCGSITVVAFRSRITAGPAIASPGRRSSRA